MLRFIVPANREANSVSNSTEFVKLAVPGMQNGSSMSGTG